MQALAWEYLHGADEETAHRLRLSLAALDTTGMTIAIVLALINSLVALLKAQTDLMVAAIAANPTKVGELIGRFTDDTRWIHLALAWQNAHLSKLIGEADASAHISALQQNPNSPFQSGAAAATGAVSSGLMAFDDRVVFGVGAVQK